MKKFLIASLVVFAALVAHDGHLYPHLGIGGVLTLALLRGILLAIPLAAALVIPHATGFTRGVLWVLFLFFLPYTIYSAAEIRHVADWCHTTPGTYFTDVCATASWTLFPTFIYALAGTAIFLFSVRRVARHRIVEAALIVFTGFATVFGLFTRINIWNAVRMPIATVEALQTNMNGIFWLNVALTCLAIASIFYSWKMLRVDGKNGS